MTDNNVTEIDLLEVLRSIKKHLLLIIILGVVFGGGAFAYAKFGITPLYKASVQLIVNTKGENSDKVTNDNINSAKNLVDTYAIIIKSNSVLKQVIDELDLDMSYSSLMNNISVSSVNNTQIMEVVVKNPSSERAGKIVSKIADIAPEIIVKKVDAGSCYVINDVEIGVNPVSPNIKRYAIVGVLLGMVLGCVIAVIRMLLNNTVIDENDIAKYLGMPVLGVIPEVSEELHT